MTRLNSFSFNFQSFSSKDIIYRDEALKEYTHKVQELCQIPYLKVIVFSAHTTMISQTKAADHLQSLVDVLQDEA